jgi:hypothetical protein
MKKSLLILGALTALSNLAIANEGMWPPHQLPAIASQLKAAGLKLNPASLSNLTEFPMGAIVSLGFCSGSFVSPQGLIVTNHHCGHGAITYNSRPERDLLKNGFLAKTLAEELPGPPGNNITVTSDVQNVSNKVITAAVAKLSGKARIDAIQNNRKALITACEMEPGTRCKVASFYGGLEFHLIKDLEVRDVRLVYAPPVGVGIFGGDTDNWVWPRHTGDFSYLRAYVGKDGKPADYSPDNVPLVPKHFLRLAKQGVKEGDFVMSPGYPGHTDRHRLPSEVEYTFEKEIPVFLKLAGQLLEVVERETKGNSDAKLKYSDLVAGINNAYKNRMGMLASYGNSDILARKQKQHAQLKAWVNADATRKAEFAHDINIIESLVAERDAQERRDLYLNFVQPSLLGQAARLYRWSNEQTKADPERRIGFQARDLNRFKGGLERVDRRYDASVDKAVVLTFLKQYVKLPADQRNASLDAAIGLRDSMADADLTTLLDKLYSGTTLGDKANRLAWLDKKPADFAASGDSMIKMAVAMHDESLKREARNEELGGKIQDAYANYMKAKIAFLKTQGQAVYPDANSTLRLTFGKIAGRATGVDGTGWKAFTTLDGITAKNTGSGDFDAPKAQLAAIKAQQYGPYADPRLHSVPVNFLATLDITGGASGSAVLNAKAELVGLLFDGTYDTIISDWDFNDANTRSIGVDLRYMLWQMRYIDKADNLLKEMKAF